MQVVAPACKTSVHGRWGRRMSQTLNKQTKRKKRKRKAHTSNFPFHRSTGRGYCCLSAHSDGTWTCFLLFSYEIQPAHTQEGVKTCMLSRVIANAFTKETSWAAGMTLQHFNSKIDWLIAWLTDCVWEFSIPVCVRGRLPAPTLGIVQLPGTPAPGSSDAVVCLFTTEMHTDI